jgi:hypothetical protein
MADSYFRFVPPGVQPNPKCNPLSYVQIFSTPLCSFGPCVCAIWASVQIIGGVPRPIITGVLCTEIQIATNNQTPTANVLVMP